MEEEKEARRMRKLMAQEMRAEDFGVESEEEAEDYARRQGGELAPGRRQVKIVRLRMRRRWRLRRLTAEEREERLAAEDGAAAANDAPELDRPHEGADVHVERHRGERRTARSTPRATARSPPRRVFRTWTPSILLMLSYCSSIVFYLLLKAEGRSVKDHPVIERLVEIRLYLEKLRPIDKKLQYQVRRLTALSTRTRRAFSPRWWLRRRRSAVM